MATDLPSQPMTGRQQPHLRGGLGGHWHWSHEMDGTDGTLCRCRRRWAILALLVLLLVLRVTAGAQATSQEWQVKAVQKYPQLGVQGSELNQRFIAEYNKRFAANPAFLNDPQWPMLLADELAAPPTTPVPAATAAPPPALPKPTAKAARATFRDQWNAVSPANRALALFAAALIVAAACQAVVRKIALGFRWTHNRAGADAYLNRLEGSDGMPAVPTHLALQADERAFYCAAASLHEPRDTRRREPVEGGFQLARGVWIPASPNLSVAQRDWEMLDSGSLTVTNQRVVFDGRSESVIIPLKRLDSVRAMGDSVELGITGRTKNMVFEAANPLLLASIIHLSRGGHDARLHAAYLRDHPEAASSSGRDTASRGNQSWESSSQPRPRETERPRPAPHEPDPEPEHILHARTLGLSGSYGWVDVKRSYHERMKEYHPDRVAGLGPKLRELAEVESRKINAAYEFFTRRFRANRGA